jgi:hypothetical protein
VTLVTLSHVTDAATMRKISFWRYLAVNLKTLLAALTCAFLSFIMLGCGQSNKLQTIQLKAALINGVAPAGQSGLVTLQGNGGTIQLQAIGSYTDSKTKDLTNVVTYKVIVDPVNGIDAFGVPLLPPCQAPCQAPGQGTAEFSNTGLITSVEPATCTWVDIAPVGGTASWFYSGDYMVTVTFEGVTSQPVFIPVASSAGNQFFPAQPPNTENNPSGQCGPTS